MHGCLFEIVVVYLHDTNHSDFLYVQLMSSPFVKREISTVGGMSENCQGGK